jgi:hypothetical protein
MKIIFWSFAAMFIVLGSMGGVSAQAFPPSAPKIHCEKMFHDFGRVRSGTTLKHEFHVTNRGNADLAIKEIISGCSCAMIQSSPERIPPGGTASLPIVFHSSNLVGEQVRGIVVKSNDPAQPEIVLKLKGHYWTPIELEKPHALITLQPGAEQKQSTKVRIINHEEEPLRLEAPVCSIPQISASIVENIPGKEFELVITTVPPFPHKDMHAMIRLTTNSKETPVIEYPVAVIAQPPLRVTPSNLLLPFQMPDTPQPYKIQISNLTPDRIKLENPTCDAPGTQIEMREVSPGKEFELIVRFSAALAKTPHQSCKVRVTSTLSSHPEIIIPVQLIHSNLILPP